MAFQRVPNTVELRCQYLLNGVNLENTYHAYSASGYNQAQVDTLAAVVDSSLAGALLADQSSHIEYIQTIARGLDQEYDITSVANTFAGPGGIAVTSMTNQVAFCVQRLSGLTGRASRGRTYVGGIPRNYQQPLTGTSNLIYATAAAAYVGHIDGGRIAIESIGMWDAVIVSRYHNGAKRAEGITTKWITTSYGSLKFATMRSRVD